MIERIMANPRKFSEKIALHNQKQAEETAAFEQIMREVIGATRDSYQKHQLHINPSLGAYRGGSLPNVNQIANNSIDLQSALNNLEDMKQGRENLTERVHRDRGRHATPHRNRHFFFDKRIDVSPYGSTSYLSPPPDTNWRRTNSDSALHQSAMSPPDSFQGMSTPPTHRRGTVHQMDNTLLLDTGQMKEYWDPKRFQQQGMLIQTRPKSCEVPGINIYPTQEDPGLMHMSISNNTGSLPDLTNLHFPSPLATPLDAEDQSLAGSAAYNQHSPSTLSVNSSHVGVSSAGGSRTLMQTSPASRHSSPGPSPSPSSQRRHHHNLSNLVIGSAHHNQQQVRYARQEPPRITVEGLSIDTGRPTNAMTFGHYLPPQHPFGSCSPHQNFSPSTSPVPQVPIGSYRSNSPSDHSCSAPTSPVSHTLSPVSSPGLGPTSSLAKSPFTDNNYYVHHQHQASVLQHQLEQFKMVADAADQEQFFMLDNGPVCTSSSPTTPTSPSVFLTSLGNGIDNSGHGDLSLDERLHFVDAHSNALVSNHDSSAIYFGIVSSGSDSHIHSPTLYSKSMVGSSSHQTTPQTPQTPTSIPDIILTGPGSDDPILRQDFAKDIGSAMASMSGSFESDLFAPEEALRAGLDPIDFDGLQILSESDMPVISDSSAEETFRLDRT